MTNEMTYLSTHSWLTFQIDLREMPAKTWIELGECAAKCDQLSGVPLKSSIRDELHMVYLVKGLQATTAIEGNTLSKEEIRKIIEDKTELPPSKGYLEQEIKNIEKAFNIIVRHISENVHVLITPEKICEYNALVLENLPVSAEVRPGEFRKYKVAVGRYLGPEQEEVPSLIEKLCNWLNCEDFRPTQEINPIVFAILKAIVSHIYIAWIHPFGDGNGRTARLIEYKILAQSGVPIPAAHILSDHYNSTRTEYYNQLDKTSKAGGKIIDFITYAVRGLLDGLNEQLKLVRSQQIEVALENYIHELFRDKPGETWRRRRHLALDLLSKSEPVSKEEIPIISKRLNDEYKNKAARTISRDISILINMGIVISKENKYEIDMRPILAFLPLRKVN